MWRKLAPTIVLLILIAFNISGSTAQSSPINYFLHNVSIDEYSLKIIKQLSSVKDRLTGHQSFYNATQFLFNELYNITNGYVVLDNYTIAVPIEDDSYILYNNIKVKTYPLWPSGGVPVNIECSGRAIVLHKLDDMDHVDLRDSIVFIDMGVDWRWLTLLDPHIGVKAIIFYGSRDSVNSRMYDKFLDAPVNLPVGYVSLEELWSSYGLTLNDLDGKYITLKLSSRWVEREAYNIYAYIPGGNHEYLIVLLTHYDSWSPAIGYAPGASDTLAPAYLLSFAKKLVSNRASYDTLIVLFSGYYQGLAGHRYFVEKYIFNGEKIVFNNTVVELKTGKTIYIGLDISSGSYYVAPVSIGYYYTAQAIGITAGPLNIYIDFIQSIYPTSIVSDKLGAVFGKDFGSSVEQLFKYSRDPNSWWMNIPGSYWLDTEPMWSSGLPAFTLKTVYVDKGYRETPMDTFENLNITSIAVQFLTIDQLLEIVYGKNADDLKACISKGLSSNAPTRISVSPRNEMFAKLVGQVMVWIPEEGRRVSLDKAGLGKALVLLKAGSRLTTTSPWNIRLAAFTDEQGYFEFIGVHTSKATGLELMAIVMDDKGSVVALNAGGSISRGTYVSIDRPEVGSRDAPWEVWVYRYYGTITINQVVDPITYQVPVEGSSIGYRVVRTDTMAEPDHYYVYFDETGFFITYVDKNMSYSIVFGPEPVYYVIREAFPGRIYGLLDALNDTSIVVKTRMDKLREYRITNPAVDQFLEKALNALDNATRYLTSHNYSFYRAYVFIGLTTIHNAYRLMKSTYLDIENTSILFSILLVFFSFIIGLYLRKPGDNPFKVILKTIGVSIVIAFVFSIIHPAFYLTVNAVMAIIGFIMIILSIPALVILFGDFNKALREIRRRKIGVHEVERSRLATSYVAFSYGVEHMKKRRLRTILTLITLIVVVISVVLFTSLSSYVAPNPIAVRGYTPTRIQGFMFQRETVDRNLPLGRHMVDVVSRIISNDTAQRYWAPTSLYIISYDNPSRSYPLEGVIGMDYLDDKVLNISKLIVKGRWFSENDTYVAIIPYSVIRDSQGIIDVDKDVVIAGVRFKVVGAYDDQRIFDVKELDGQSFTPVIGFPRARALRVAIVPIRIASYDPWRGKGVSLTLSQISSITREDPYTIGRYVMYVLPALDTYVYSVDKGVSRYSRLIALQGAGFNYIIAPLIIASVSILGVMLGTIYERRREIYIYASLGLSPTQIGLMFIAEALAYALVATVVGFAIGIVLTNIAAIALPEVFKPNYSSGYVILALSTTFISVLLATIYPVYKASKMALPSLRRRWEFPTKPVGDEWVIPLPFKITTVKELRGAITYMYEYLSGFTSPDIGSFVVEKIGVTKSSLDGKNMYMIEGEARLKPWHAGVKQLYQIRAVETNPNEWDISIYLKRLSGNDRIWVRSNKVFIDALRKQLLLWRTLHSEDKEIYVEKAKDVFKDL